MREISVEAIKDAVKKLFINSNYELPEDVLTMVKQSRRNGA